MLESYPWYKLLPDESEEVHEEYLHLFFDTMLERQCIWERRFIQELERPWTDDPILRDNKFTNVYRELDRNSQWQIKNILLDDSLNLTNLIWKLMVFRAFNNPNTFSCDLAKRWKNGIPNYDEYNEEEFAQFIRDVRASGANPFTNAYLINSVAAKGYTRDYCYYHLTIPTIHKSVPRIIAKAMTASRPEELIEEFKKIPTVAGFMAHELYQDFTYIARYTNRKFMKFTQNDFTNVGPGAMVGIRLVFPSTPSSSQEKRIYDLRDMAEEQLKLAEIRKGVKMPYLHWDKENKKYYTSGECNITLHQIEMWLCEFQKYWKMLNGVGKQRSKFTPKGKTAML